MPDFIVARNEFCHGLRANHFLGVFGAALSGAEVVILIHMGHVPEFALSVLAVVLAAEAAADFGDRQVSDFIKVVAFGRIVVLTGELAFASGRGIFHMKALGHCCLKEKDRK